MKLTTIGIALLLMLSATACSLSSANADLENTEPTATEAVAATNTPPPAPTTLPLPTATVTLAPTQVSGGTGTVCTLRTDWTVVYTIRTGDTLSRLARDAGTTTGTLADANCIANVNTIQVGQQIRLPRQIVPTSTPTATFEPPISQQPPERVGGVSPSEILSGDAGFITLVRDSAITVRWDDPPSGIVRAAFFVFPPGWTFDHAGPGTIEIGQDINGSDGWSVPWSVPSGMSGELVAFGYSATGRLSFYTWSIHVSSALPATTACRIRPIGDAVVAYHEDPDANSSMVGTFDALNAVPILGRSLNGWYAISTNVDFSGVGGVAALKWVPPTAPVSSEGANCG